MDEKTKITQIFEEIEHILFEKKGGFLLKIRMLDSFDKELFDELCLMIDKLPMEPSENILIRKIDIILLIDIVIFMDTFSNKYSQYLDTLVNKIKVWLS
jgi:hypothetical protein